MDKRQERPSMSSLLKTNLKRRKNSMKGGKQCSLEESIGE
jgi:hypothetical protein